MFLKVSQTYHVINRLTSLRPSQMEAKGVAVLQRDSGDDTSEGSSPAEAGYRESTGDEQKSSQACICGTSLQHKVKSSIHYKQCPCILGTHVLKDMYFLSCAFESRI